MGRRPLGGSRPRAAAGWLAGWLAPSRAGRARAVAGPGGVEGRAAARPAPGFGPGRTRRKSQPSPGLGIVSQGDAFAADAFQGVWQARWQASLFETQVPHQTCELAFPFLRSGVRGTGLERREAWGGDGSRPRTCCPPPEGCPAAAGSSGTPGRAQPPQPQPRREGGGVGAGPLPHGARHPDLSTRAGTGFLLALMNSQGHPSGRVLSPPSQPPAREAALLGSRRPETFPRVRRRGAAPAAPRCAPVSVSPRSASRAPPQASRQPAEFCFLSIMQKINQPGRRAERSTAACN